MKRTDKNSRIEIWSENYLSDESIRSEEDKNVKILQLACAQGSEKYLVEFIPTQKTTANLLPHFQDGNLYCTTCKQHFEISFDQFCDFNYCPKCGCKFIIKKYGD